MFTCIFNFIIFHFFQIDLKFKKKSKFVQHKINFQKQHVICSTIFFNYILQILAIFKCIYIFLDNLRFKNDELFQIWLLSGNKEKKKEALLNVVLEKNGEANPSEEYLKYLREKLRLFCIKLDKKWQESSRKSHYFKSRNAQWLKSEIIFKNYRAISEVPRSSLGAGRPRLIFSDMSDRSKRREAAELSTSKQNETDLLLRAACVSARKGGKNDLAVVLKETMQSPTRPSKLRKLCHKDAKKPVALSDEEALAFLLENNFSKRQYCNIRMENKQRNCNIFPSYKRILAVKAMCRPNDVVVSERVAKVPLQKLLQHTATRIVEMQKEVILAAMNFTKSTSIFAELILSYGFDSSTGQAQFKQQAIDPNSSQNTDSSIFTTSVIPLRLIDSMRRPLWCNITPQSTRFCRPLKLEFVKETREVILKENSDLNKEIEELTTVTVQIDKSKTIEINFALSLTVIDGKVLNVLTGTKSNLSCPICGATSKDFLKIKDYNSEKFKPKESNLKYGISPLHCRIRFFEFLLHLGYKCEIKKWQIREEKDRENVSKRKQKIQNEFWTELGLRVDFPKVGGFGSTNDGNTSRRAFTNYKKFARITGVDEVLIFRLHIILICLTCQFPLELDKFEQYCFETARHLQSNYEWLPMTPTVHKVLIHSKQIMQNIVLPVGCFGEDAAECRNKIYKNDRLFHARRSSRINNLSDVFNRALDTSDPLVSSLRLHTRIHQRKRLALPPEVIQLLICEEPIEQLISEQDVDGDESTDEEYEDEFEDDNIILESELDITDT